LERAVTEGGTVLSIAAPGSGQESGAAATPSAMPGRTASRTVRAYDDDWTGFQAWCRKAGCPPLPASPDDVAAYLAALVADRPRSRGTLDRQLAAIGRAHRAADHAWDTQHPAIRAVLRAAPRGTRARRLTPGQMRHLAMACGSDLAGLRDRALLLLHLAAGLRRGEAVGLDAEHVRSTPAGLHLLLVPPEGEEGEQAPPVERAVAPGTDAATCPVRALRAWLDASACRHGPVFRKVDRWGHVEHERLRIDEVRRILLRRAGKAKLGLHTSQRLQSPRRGSAQTERPGGQVGTRIAEPQDG